MEGWEVDEHNGVAHWSYGGTEGNKFGFERFGSEIHRRTVNGTTIEGKEWPKEDDHKGWRDMGKERWQSNYSMVKKKEKREDQ